MSTHEPQVQWHTVDAVYHATDKESLTDAEQSETLEFRQPGHAVAHRPCSLFSCKLWHDDNGQVHNKAINDGRPTRSPYALNRVIIPAADVLESPQDFLIPIMPYHIPPFDPDKHEFLRSRGGRTYVEMVYIRLQDILDANLNIDSSIWHYLQTWQLQNHPFVRLDSQSRLKYRVIIHHVWWIILTTYEVPIPHDAIWELDLGGEKVPKKRRHIDNRVTQELVSKLSAFL